MERVRALQCLQKGVSSSTTETVAAMMVVVSRETRIEGGGVCGMQKAKIRVPIAALSCGPQTNTRTFRSARRALKANSAECEEVFSSHVIKPGSVETKGC